MTVNDMPINPSRRRRADACCSWPPPPALPAWSLAQRAPAAIPIEVWKGPTCGCCKDWIAHLQANGFAARVHERQHRPARRTRHADPLWVLPTALVGGYAIEGHVPARELRRLLAENPRPSAWRCRRCRSVRRAWTGRNTAAARMLRRAARAEGRQRGGLSVLHLKGNDDDDDDADEEAVDGALFAAAVRRPPWRLPPR